MSVALPFDNVVHAAPGAQTYGGTRFEFATSVQQTSDGGYIVAGSTSTLNAGYDGWLMKLDASGMVAWQKTLGGTGAEVVNSVQQTSDGGYVAAGFTQSFGAGSYDAWVLKLDANGNVTWQRSYGGAVEDNAHSCSKPVTAATLWQVRRVRSARAVTTRGC